MLQRHGFDDETGLPGFVPVVASASGPQPMSSLMFQRYGFDDEECLF